MPPGDAARADGLRNAALAEAVRAVKESLDETSTPTPAPKRSREPARGAVPPETPPSSTIRTHQTLSDRATPTAREKLPSTSDRP